MELTGRKVCVTGGTGFLGGHLLPLLLEAGAEITCLARPSQKPRHLPAGVSLKEGDCVSGAGLKDAFANQDIVIHMAAMLFGCAWQDYLSANARAAENISEIMSQLPPESRPVRIIHVSSLAAAGPCALAPGLAETARPAPVSAYGWSKLFSEKLLLAAPVKKIVVLRPAIIYGSGDGGLLPVFRGVKKGIGVSPGFGRQFPISAIHAHDAARAIIMACADQAEGVYHLSDGQIYNMDVFCKAMATALGKNGVFMAHMPLWIMGVSAMWCSGFAGMAGYWAKKSGSGPYKPPHWNLDKFREARQAGWLANSGRIQRELGFGAVMSLEMGMAEAVAGYRRAGLL